MVVKVTSCGGNVEIDGNILQYQVRRKEGTKRWRMSREIQTIAMPTTRSAYNVRRNEGNEDGTFRRGFFSICQEIYS